MHARQALHHLSHASNLGSMFDWWADYLNYLDALFIMIKYIT
jgi:hypothetical protein